MQCIQTIYIHILPTFYQEVCIIKKGDNSLLIYGICYAAGNIYIIYWKPTKAETLLSRVCCDVTRYLVTTIVDVIIEHIGMTTTMTMKMTIRIER